MIVKVDATLVPTLPEKLPSLWVARRPFETSIRSVRTNQRSGMNSQSE